MQHATKFYVYVLSEDGQPLMPTKPSRARRWVKSGKAKTIKRNPWTVQLTVETGNARCDAVEGRHASRAKTQDITVGIDTGTTEIGSAAVRDTDGQVLYQGSSVSPAKRQASVSEANTDKIKD